MKICWCGYKWTLCHLAPFIHCLHTNFQISVFLPLKHFDWPRCQKCILTWRLNVMDCLFSVTALCLMFDGWSDDHNAPHFLGIRAAIIADNWSSMVVTLSCKPCPQDAAGISEHVASELSDLGLTPDVLKDKLVLTTHDGASVMFKTSRPLNSKYPQHCCSHSLHLLLNGQKLSRSIELIASCRGSIV